MSRITCYWACIVKFKQLTLDGRTKNINQGVLVESQSYTESEAIITEIFRSNIHEDFSISSLHPTKIKECFPHDSNAEFPWWECTIRICHYEEERKKNIVTDTLIIVQEETISKALSYIANTIKEGNIVGIELSKISHVYLSDQEKHSIQQWKSSEEMILIAYGKEVLDCYHKALNVRSKEELLAYQEIIDNLIKETGDTPVVCGKRLRNQYQNNIGPNADIFLGVAVKMEIEK